jgi:hypothetical protein
LPAAPSLVKPIAYPHLAVCVVEEPSVLPGLILFAQKQPPGPPPEVGAFLGAFFTIWAAFLCVGVVISLIAMTLAIMHLVTEFKALSLVKPRNRTMEPGMIFLIFIPLFGIVWQFFIVMRLAESLRNEFEDRNWSTEGEGFGFAMGMTMAIMNLACFPFNLIFLIIHWRQISGYAQLLSGNRRRR